MGVDLVGPLGAGTDEAAGGMSADGTDAGAMAVPVWVEGGITEAELTALALAGNPDQPLDPAARPDPAIRNRGPLPLTYMPPSTTGPRPRTRVTTVVAVVLVTAFVVITALGFCITYGALAPA